MPFRWNDYTSVSDRGHAEAFPKAFQRNWSRSVARKETLGVHQKNWVCHIYCQINAQKKQACLLGINMLV